MELGKIILIAALLLACMNVHAQTCKDSINSTTPDSRFVDNGDGTVNDEQTGLIWMRCALGQNWDGATCIGSASTYTWQQALTVAEGNVFGGSDAWRLPNIKELNSIIERACVEPSINQSIFPVTSSSGFWSSSLKADSDDYGWFVSFGNGSSNYTLRYYDGYIRLVRSESD